MQIHLSGIYGDAGRLLAPETKVLIASSITGAPGHKIVILSTRYVQGACSPPHRYSGDMILWVQDGVLTVTVGSEQAVAYEKGSGVKVTAGTPVSTLNASEVTAAAIEILIPTNDEQMIVADNEFVRSVR